MSRSFLQIVAGQAVWAVAQAALVLFLSWRGEFVLLGNVMLGLAIFAPVCMLGSLDLRTLLVVRPDAAAGMASAFRLRGIMTMAGLVVTGAILLPVSDNIHDWAVAMALIGIRVADQMSDVAIGHYQTAGLRGRIARSLTLRGLGGVVPFVAVYAAGGGLVSSAMAALAGALLAMYLADMRPVLARAGDGAGIGELLALVRRNIWISPQPIIDSLFVSSFRYALFLLASAEALGLAGVAQTLFVPIQLLTSALAYGHLPNATRLAGRADAPGFRRHLRKSLLRGTILNLGFLIAVAIVPVRVLDLIFAGRGAEAWPILLLVGVAMLPRTAYWLAGLSVVARGGQFAYSFAPFLSLCLFWVLTGGAVLVGAGAPLTIVAGAFFLSGVLRLAYALRHALKPFPAG